MIIYIRQQKFRLALRIRYDKKNLFSVGTIKIENISREQLLSDIGKKNNDMHMGIIHWTICNS